MASGRAERAFLSILCGIAVVTASPPVATASAPAGEPAAGETTAEVAPARVFRGTTEVPAPPSAGGVEASASASEPPVPDEPTAAQPDDGGDAAATPVEDDAVVGDEIPERLTPMQAAGWWTIFGGVAVGTLAGVMAGLAERQEDRALRLSVRFEIDTGAQTRYEDVQGEYEAALRRGRAQAGAGIGLAVVGLAALVAGVAVLGVASARAKRDRPAQSGARLQWRGSGMQVRF